MTEFRPAGRVGTRVPHRWLDEARTRSTIDLAGPGWAVLAGEAEVDFLPAGHALLLRPDHIVAWRGPGPGGDGSRSSGGAFFRGSRCRV